MTTGLTLRYFNARGRAQFLRYYLRVRNIDFEDARVPIEADFASWMAMRDDSSLTGPFCRLPVLETGQSIIAEALVIAHYLHTQLGDAEVLDSDTELQHRQLISSLYTDVITSVGTLLWAERLFVGLDFPAYTTGAYKRQMRNLQQLEKTLAQWQWRATMDRRPIMLADCLLWECIDWNLCVFGPHFSLESYPILAGVHARYASGTAFSELLSDSPCQITATDREPEVIERIQQILSG